jgi:hypothetical protein
LFIPDPDFLPLPDPGSNGQKGIRDPDPQLRLFSIKIWLRDRAKIFSEVMKKKLCTCSRTGYIYI